MDRTDLSEIRQAIRDVPDFAKPGIVFKDITPVLLDPSLFAKAVELMARPYHGAGVTRVVSIESRGFLLGAPVALALAAGLVPIRKPAKLPALRDRGECALEYGTDALEMHLDAVQRGDQVLVVDDVLATGGTAEAAGKLVTNRGAELVGFTFLIELEFLHGRRRLSQARVEALLGYTQPLYITTLTPLQLRGVEQGFPKPFAGGSSHPTGTDRGGGGGPAVGAQ